MSYIKTNPLKNSTIMYLYAERDEIQLDPPYQRMGGVWTKEKKQLLIDSILNDYDIPKIYFHAFDRSVVSTTGFEYAVIDGRQRLEAIWDFVDGEFSLAVDFDYQKDTSIKLAGLSYDDISQHYPRIKIQFDSFTLPVVLVETDDDDLIEDMFSRLNEAVPLNAAEKRNSIGGDFVAAVRKISEHRLFESCVAFTNKRYQYREVSARLLLIEDSLSNHNRLVDTKKVYLDALARKYAKNNLQIVRALEADVFAVINEMSTVFTKQDPLLRAQGNMAILYLVFRLAVNMAETHLITRRKLLDFNISLKKNRDLAASDYEKASYELLEYDRLSQQGTNDASNIKERVFVLATYLGLSKTSLL
tara:strand:+ start:951 stop:2030 length:1080 start_codon:yes stop_codon:yes gene_type:complete